MLHRPVKVGYNLDFAPFCFEEHGSARGLVIERVATIFESSEIPFEFLPVRLPDMITALDTGRVDVLAGIASTLDRRSKLSFSKPLVMTGGAWFALKGGSVDCEPDAGAWRVVTPAAGPLAAPIQKRYPLIKLETCGDYDAALQTVVNGKADAAALNFHVGKLLCDKNYPDMFQRPAAPFFPVPLAIALKPADPLNILQRLNVHILDAWANA